MAIYILFLSRFELYDFSKAFQEESLWFVVFTYGVLSSVVIVFLTFKIKAGHWLKITFHILAGYGIFLFYGFNVFTMNAGTVGAIAALVFFYGTALLKNQPVLV